MLTEERFAKILALLKEKNTVSVAELTELLESSESDRPAGFEQPA